MTENDNNTETDTDGNYCEMHGFDPVRTWCVPCEIEFEARKNE